MVEKKPDLANVGNLPKDLHSIPVDRERHWSILDQTKVEFKKSGRSGIVLHYEEDAAYKKRLADFLAKYGFKWETGKPYLVIEHATEAKELFNLVTQLGLRAELVKANQP